MWIWWTRAGGASSIRPSSEVCEALTETLNSNNRCSSSHLLLLCFSFLLGDEFASVFLIRHSAQVNAATVGAVETPLHLVCSFSPKKHSAEVMAGMAGIAEALLKTGANPNMQNSKGRYADVARLTRVYQLTHYYYANNDVCRFQNSTA